MGRRGISAFILQPSPLGYLASKYWSPSALWVIGLVVVLTGLGFVIAAVNAAIRIVFAMGRKPCQGRSPGCPATRPPSSRSAALPSSRCCSGCR